MQVIKPCHEPKSYEIEPISWECAFGIANLLWFNSVYVVLKMLLVTSQRVTTSQKLAESSVLDTHSSSVSLCSSSFLINVIVVSWGKSYV